MKMSFIWTVVATLVGSGVGAAVVTIGWEAYQGWVPKSELHQELRLRHVALGTACERTSKLDGVRVINVLSEYEKPISSRFRGIETNQLITQYADKLSSDEGVALMRVSGEMNSLVAHRLLGHLSKNGQEYTDDDLYFCFGELREFFGLKRGEICKDTEGHVNCDLDSPN